MQTPSDISKSELIVGPEGIDRRSDDPPFDRREVLMGLTAYERVLDRAHLKQEIYTLLRIKLLAFIIVSIVTIIVKIVGMIFIGG